MHLLEAYRHVYDNDDLPWRWHEWAALSATAAAACAGRQGQSGLTVQVWQKQITPNLYVALLGDIGHGHDQAVRNVQELMAQNPLVNGGDLAFIAPHAKILISGDGDLSPKSRISKEQANKSCVYLINEDLAYTCASREYLCLYFQMLFRYMNGSGGLTSQGLKDKEIMPVAPDLCLNFLGASTLNYLDVFRSKPALVDRFWGKLMPIIDYRSYTDSVKIPKPVRELKHMRDYVAQHLIQISLLSGVIDLDPLAKRAHTFWTKGGKAPRNDTQRALFFYRQDLVVKFACLESLQAWDHREGPYPYVITGEQMEAGIARWDQFAKDSDDFHHAIMDKPDELEIWVKDKFVRRASRVISRTDLRSLAHQKGWKAVELNRVTDKWQKQGLIEYRPMKELFPGMNRTGYGWRWIGGS